MIAGFDYGTSNCALSLWLDDCTQAIRLDHNSPYMPSLLYAESRDSIAEYVAAHLASTDTLDNYSKDRHAQLAGARNYRRENGIPSNEALVHFGSSAMKEYVLAPTEGHFSKSPKSFLGASGLSDKHIAFFEDIVTAMMMRVNQQYRQTTEQDLSHLVIGRPVNFSSLDHQSGNRQALQILTNAAKRSGYKHVEFLYEPLAAGLAYERRLENDALVLVLDIGGGTSDCTMMHMGPSYRHKDDRSRDILGHCGTRTGGNDFDIQLAISELMPLMGLNSSRKDGLPLPNHFYWNAAKINDVNAQAEFFSPENARAAQDLLKSAERTELVKRFIHMLKHKQNFSLIKSSELAKIHLSTQSQSVVDLSYIEPDLHHTISSIDFAQAVEGPLSQISALIRESLTQANSLPDQVFITGGSGQSPLITSLVQRLFGEIDIVDGDHFGSVVEGLAHWAGKIYR